MKKDILAAIDEALAVGNRLCDIEDTIFDVHQHVVLLEKSLISSFGPDWDENDPDVLEVAEVASGHAFKFWAPVEGCWNCGAAFDDDGPKHELGMCLECHEYGNNNDDDPTEHFSQWGEVDGIPIMRSSQNYKQHMFVFIGEAHPYVDTVGYLGRGR